MSCAASRSSAGRLGIWSASRAPAMIYKVLSDPELSFLARMEWFRERAYGIRPVADRVGTQIIWYDFDQAWAVALRRMSNYRLRQRGYQVKPL
jgi:hypothetical protein